MRRIVSALLILLLLLPSAALAGESGFVSDVDRINEAARTGFTDIYLPEANYRKFTEKQLEAFGGVRMHPVADVRDILQR